MGDSFRSDVLFFNAFPKAGLAAGTPITTNAIKTRHWRVKTVAIHNDQGAEAGPPDDVIVDVLVKLRDGKFTPLKSASGGFATANKVFTFSFEDVFEEIKVTVTPGVTLPERISVQVNAGRETIG